MMSHDFTPHYNNDSVCVRVYTPVWCVYVCVYTNSLHCYTVEYRMHKKLANEVPMHFNYSSIINVIK